MTLKWLEDFRSSLRSMAPRIEVTQERGRLLQTGDYYYHRDVERETRCYRDVHCYTEKGAGEHYETIFQALKQVHDFLRARERGHFRFNMYSFGSIDEHRTQGKLSRFLRYDKEFMKPMNNMPAFAKTICARAGTEIGEGNPFIPNLSDVGRDDLVVIFTRSGIGINETSEGSYNRNRKHVFWFFVDGQEPDFIHGKEFEPNFIHIEAAEVDELAIP